MLCKTLEDMMHEEKHYPFVRERLMIPYTGPSLEDMLNYLRENIIDDVIDLFAKKVANGEMDFIGEVAKQINKRFGVD